MTGQPEATAERRELLRPEDLPQLLGLGVQRLEVEIGCGNGHFLAEYSRMHPSSFLIGVEVKKKRCLKAQGKIQRQQLSNARVIHGSAEAVLRYLSDGSVDCFHLYFPDPWPKTRHRRRRFLRKENMEVLQRKLKNGGLLFFATDFFDYYLHTKILLLIQGGIRLSRQAPSQSVFRSVFAQRFAEKGKQIRTLTAEKMQDSSE
ncbi:MAG: methyltransferase domain-containing protein [Spirochaetaceae bacterium]|nr:MAG: methyltransferase domain-containing protein [Spirochaetaceae bacterium]